jgi:hypothetical protein
LIGAKLIDLTGDAPLVSEPLYAGSNLLADKHRLFTTNEVTGNIFGASATVERFRPA